MSASVAGMGQRLWRGAARQGCAAITHALDGFDTDMFRLRAWVTLNDDVDVPLDAGGTVFLLWNRVVLGVREASDGWERAVGTGVWAWATNTAERDSR